jgi:acyl-CoA thioesterase
VTPTGDSRFTASIGPEWMLAVAPQGGIVGAIAARAMQAVLGSEIQALRSFHAVFASPVPAGPLVVDVVPIRTGRSMSQLSATVRAADAAAGLTALAVFGGPRPGFAHTELAFPDVAPPEECPSYRDPPPPEVAERGTPFPFWTDVLEGRPALGHAPWDPSPREGNEVATWFRFDHRPLDDQGRFDPLALLVAADMMPSAVFESIGFVEEQWFAPSVDLTVHLRALPTGEWILNHNRAHYSDDGYASAESALWDAHAPGGPVLLAYATQVMFFTRID